MAARVSVNFAGFFCRLRLLPGIQTSHPTKITGTTRLRAVLEQLATTGAGVLEVCDASGARRVNNQ